MAKYYKLSEKATTFSDVSSGTHITNKQAVKLEASQINASRLLKHAIANAHLVECDEAYYKANKKPDEPKAEEPARVVPVAKVVTPDEDEDEEEDDEVEVPKKATPPKKSKK